MRTATSEMATAKMSVTVSHAPASSPSEWARNPKTTSMATSARLRPSTTRRRVSRVMGTSVRASPAQLPQPGVVDAEVMGDLVHDHAPHLLHDLVLGVAHGADGTPVDRDAVGHAARVADPPHGQGYAFVEAEQAPLRRQVFDEHSHVVHVAAELGGDAVEGVRHQLLEAFPRDVDHPPTLFDG